MHSAKKKVSKKTTTTTKATKKIDYKDLIIEVLALGHGAVESMIKEHNLKPGMVRKAANALAETHPEQGSLFIQWVNQRYPVGGRGKTPPQVGDLRTYKAQQVKNKKTNQDGAPFVRCPLTTLGIKKGEEIDIKFDDDRIVITRAKGK